MPQMFNNRCTDVFSGAELLDMCEAFQYKHPKLVTNYETYLNNVDRSLAARITYSGSTNVSSNPMSDPFFMLKKVLCFDLNEYDRRVEEQKEEAKILRKAHAVIKKYSQE